ncbi:tektin-2-like [Homarus americanus]|uniref:tektin-2-like n=1 Tax=Homarus americanus TaxID=6706 RepID=UPI001C450310|nr:tektin-2-like [Homarus americanus]XP_042234110.1 tektin-2-like [Homarus americanus]
MRVEKPVMRYLPADWHRNNDALRQASHDTRTTSHNFRHQSHHLRDQTRNKTCWDCEDNTTRLHDRVYELQRVTDDLQRSLKQVNDEISKLENAKETAEAELEAHVYPLNTALECLTIRERRREGDLVKDDPEIQLQQEVRLLEKSRANLEKVVLEAVSHLRVLHDAKQRLQDDLKDKRAALQVDGTQTALTVYSPQISFKPDPLRVPKGTILPADWLDHSLKNMAVTEAAIRDSQTLRDNMCVTIQTVRREDEAQQTATDYSVRRRLHQETRARDELQWQKDCLLEEIRAQEKEILDLEEQLRASSLPLKVAQTRLEGRTQRVRNDLVRDAPQDGLMAEVQHLTETRRLLRDSLARALDTLHALQRHLRTVDVDLGRKSLSVTLEKKVQGSRQALKDRKPSETLTHTNLTLTGSLRAHPTHIL